MHLVPAQKGLDALNLNRVTRLIADVLSMAAGNLEDAAIALNGTAASPASARPIRRAAYDVATYACCRSGAQHWRSTT